jgi:cytochrome c oxidase assembly factor CtaG
MFVATALLFWSQVIDSRPVHAHVDLARRSVYVLAPMVVGWVLALVLAFARRPLYDYAALARRPGGLTALADQHIAAGIMWVPGSIAYVIAVVVFFYRWLEPEPADAFSGRRNGSPLGVGGS